jgi:hypothetical protein
MTRRVPLIPPAGRSTVDFSAVATVPAADVLAQRVFVPEMESAG